MVRLKHSLSAFTSHPSGIGPQFGVYEAVGEEVGEVLGHPVKIRPGAFHAPITPP